MVDKKLDIAYVRSVFSIAVSKKKKVVFNDIKSFAYGVFTSKF